MQPYERIGLVALMFLVVILAVGALWDDGSSDDALLAAERPTIERVDEEAQARAAAAESQDRRVRAARAHLAQENSSPENGLRQSPLRESPLRQGAARSLRMGGQDELEKRVNRVTTASAGTDHRSEPVGNQGGLAVPAKAQTADELAGLTYPNSGRVRRSGGSEVSMSKLSPRRRASADEPAIGARRSAPQVDRSEAPTRPEALAQAPRPAPKQASTYTVRPGDVLQRIAAAQLGDASRSAEIAALNGLSDPDMIRIGMVLTLPSDSAAPKAGQGRSDAASSGVSSAGGSSSGAAASGSAAVGARYTVKSGESLSRALTRELGTYRRSIKLVQALNPGLNPDRVMAGQVINLPRLEDIPAAKKAQPARPASSNGRGPALDTSPRSTQVAAAERTSPARSASARSVSSRTNDEFVVR